MNKRATVNRLHFFSLRTVLTVPYVLLVLFLALTLGVLSYRTGSDAVKTVAEHLLQETVERISQAIDRHVIGSVATLEAAFPNGMTAPACIEEDYDNLRTRFWIATTLHIDPNNYVYYGNNAGQAIGLYRHSYEKGELRIKFNAEEHRKIYQIDGINGKLRSKTIEPKLFDPRKRPWYIAGQAAGRDIWTSVYIDFGTRALVATRARKVLNRNNEVEGVVATDMPLEALNDFVSNLDISENGLAFIIESDGNLIASSVSPNVQKNADGENIRVNAAQSGHPLLTEIYLHLKPYLAQSLSPEPHTLLFTNSQGQEIHVAYNHFKDDAGLSWVNVVAIPKDDFMGGIPDNVTRTIILAIAATILVICIGFWIVHWVTDDLKMLSRAVSKVGSGMIEDPVDIQRKDEIGNLAKSFLAMQRRLQTDYLTGLPNRYAFEQFLQTAILRYKQAENPIPFAILFIDINNFKLINDRFGHDSGDQALIEFALRLKTHVRPNDFVARFAGDEFVILLSDIRTRKDIPPIKQGIIKALSAPLKSFDNSSLKIGGAVGEAYYPEDGETAGELMVVADQKMYINKAEYKS